MHNATISFPSWGGIHSGIPLNPDFLRKKVPPATSPAAQRLAALSATFHTPLSCLLHGAFLSALLIGLLEQPGSAKCQKGGIPAPEDRVTVLEGTVSSQQAQINTLVAALAEETAGAAAVKAPLQSSSMTISLTHEDTFLGRDI